MHSHCHKNTKDNIYMKEVCYKSGICDAIWQFIKYRILAHPLHQSFHKEHFCIQKHFGAKIFRSNLCLAKFFFFKFSFTRFLLSFKRLKIFWKKTSFKSNIWLSYWRKTSSSTAAPLKLSKKHHKILQRRAVLTAPYHFNLFKQQRFWY